MKKYVIYGSKKDYFVGGKIKFGWRRIRGRMYRTIIIEN